jgi:hypothetical protein
MQAGGGVTASGETFIGDRGPLAEGGVLPVRVVPAFNAAKDSGACRDVCSLLWIVDEWRLAHDQ